MSAQISTPIYMSESDVPNTNSGLDFEMLMWDVINMSEGRVERTLWEESMLWLMEEKPEVAWNEMWSGEPPVETQKLWAAWRAAGGAESELM